MKNNTDLIVASEKFKVLSRYALLNMNLTTSSRILNEWSKKLDNEFASCKGMLRKSQKKHYPINQRHEYDLDTILFMQSMLGALKSFFNVLIFIKLEVNFKAWSSLVDARDYIKVAESYIDKYPQSKHETKPGVEILLAKHQLWEKSFFPENFVFTSSGLKETIGDCSICCNKFTECEHIEGYIYHGKYCQRINRRIIEANHVAIVDVPRDRRCIITSRHDEQGYQIDFFSRERLENKDKPDRNAYESIVLNINGIDI